MHHVTPIYKQIEHLPDTNNFFNVDKASSKLDWASQRRVVVPDRTIFYVLSLTMVYTGIWKEITQSPSSQSWAIRLSKK